MSPLTKSGKKILREFKREYGSRGKSVFYATMRKYPKLSSKWHRKR